MLSKIISGGQTGADRAALDAALNLGFPIGGTCPVGRMAEDGPMSSIYTLEEVSGDYRQRNHQNVQSADGTAIFYSSYLQGGTEATALFCIQQSKPYKLIDIELIDPLHAAMLLADFVHDHHITVLNVAGSRASTCPVMYDYVKQAVELVIKQSR
ncbi:YpsA SLOG family protein [Vreelandella zhaodongensis]|uniref:YpsA SLOG family protein n=1 Tax=Vreelandella zhaodongensis TaxID=1176240 RepID=UPI003EBD5E07